jgi:hypothetical protein
LNIELNRDMRIFSFDIENMYANIPKRDILNIINNVLEATQKFTCIARKK